MPRLQMVPHPHSTIPLLLEKDVTLEKLPPLRREGSSAHHLPSRYQTNFQERLPGDRERKMVAMNEWQQEYSREKVKQTFQLNTDQRQYNSAGTKHNVYPEERDYDVTVRKTSGVDQAFPLKPVCHRRAYNLNNCQPSSDAMTFKLSESDRRYSYVPSPPRDRLDHDRRVENKHSREPQSFDRVPRLQLQEDRTNGRTVDGPQHLRGDPHRLADGQVRLAREIRRKETILQEKLWRAEEELRKIQEERAASGDYLKREDRNRRNLEKEKRENRVYLAEQGSWERGGERERERRVWRNERQREGRERVTERDWEKAKGEDMGRWVRKERDASEGERERRRSEKLLEWERERRKAERATEGPKNGEWDRKARESGRERERGRAELEREWERERGRTERDREWERERERAELEREWERDRRKTEKGTGRDRDEMGEWDRWERREKEKMNDGEWRRKERGKTDRDIRWEREGEGRREMREREETSTGTPKTERTRSNDDGGKTAATARRRQTQEWLKLAQRPAPEGRGSSDGKGVPREPARAAPVSPAGQWSGQLQQVELHPDETPDASVQLVPCRVCGRSFAADRLERHRSVCKKMQSSSRKVFNSSQYRAKGTDLEEFMKTNGRSKTPELKKTNWRQKHEVFIRNLRQARIPATGGLQARPSADPDPDYVACPHCARRFAPGPAERHIPLCQNIRSRPPPPRPRR